MLVKMGYEEMFVKLTTTQQIHLAAKVYEGVYADEACTKAVAYDYAPHSLKAGTNWYNIDLKTLRDNNQGLKITYKATAGTSKIVSMILPTAPALVSQVSKVLYLMEKKKFTRSPLLLSRA
jgi:hypothetical protein